MREGGKTMGGSHRINELKIIGEEEIKMALTELRAWKRIIAKASIWQDSILAENLQKNKLCLNLLSGRRGKGYYRITKSQLTGKRIW